MWTNSLNANHCQRFLPVLDRRDYLRRSAFGFGASVLGSLIAGESAASEQDSKNPVAAREPHFPAKAKRVIFFFCAGGPSQLETFDPKPALTKYNGQPIPESFRTEGLALQFMKASDGKLMASQFEFQKHGQSGLEIS